jgi:hypothetical protein
VESALRSRNARIQSEDLPQRVDEAKAAINTHRELNNRMGNNAEDERLLNALAALDQLIRMRCVGN